MEEKQFMYTEFMLDVIDIIEKHLQEAHDEYEAGEKLEDPFDKCLKRAAYNAEVAAADELVDKYRNCRDKFGHSLLHLALTKSAVVASYLIDKRCFDLKEKTYYGLTPLQIVSYLEDLCLTKQLIETGDFSAQDFFYKVKEVRAYDLYEKGKDASELAFNPKQIDAQEKGVLETLLPKAINSAYINGVNYGDYEMVQCCIDAAWDIATSLHPSRGKEADDCYELYLGAKEAVSMDNAMILAVKNKDAHMVDLLRVCNISVFEQNIEGEDAFSIAKSSKYFDQDTYVAICGAKMEEEIRIKNNKPNSQTNNEEKE